MKLRVIILFLVILTSACVSHSAASKTNAQHAGDGTQPLSGMFSQQRLCAPKWRHIYEQWLLNGGGIKSTMIATRKQIASDQKSTLARIIRKVWSSPKNPSVNKKQLWGWPVAEKNARQLSFLFGDASEGYVPSECAMLVWLPPIIWNSSILYNRDPLEIRMPVEAPSAIDWKTHTREASDWVMYWLLAKLPVQATDEQSHRGHPLGQNHRGQD